MAFTVVIEMARKSLILMEFMQKESSLPIKKLSLIYFLIYLLG